MPLTLSQRPKTAVEFFWTEQRQQRRTPSVETSWFLEFLRFVYFIPWLPVDDVEVCQLATTSRGVRRGRSSRPRPHRVLCFPHHRQWTMEYLCKTQAHAQAALQAQLEAQERADVWWSSLLRTRFEDGAVDVAWDAFVRLFRAKFVPEHIQDKME
ncbi:hypothetical protein Taro_009495 [Colocasia esculenta]|uniref:Uncharacterized protein n=1 Tax=Colocasia esculenta TaxID=4460 RepID=A0A843U0J0_COLES|nr:hypothetical protein [Colocasia esculenta]